MVELFKSRGRSWAFLLMALAGGCGGSEGQDGGGGNTKKIFDFDDAGLAITVEWDGEGSANFAIDGPSDSTEVEGLGCDPGNVLILEMDGVVIGGVAERSCSDPTSGPYDIVVSNDGPDAINAKVTVEFGSQIANYSFPVAAENMGIAEFTIRAGPFSDRFAREQFGPNYRNTGSRDWFVTTDSGFATADLPNGNGPSDSTLELILSFPSGGTLEFGYGISGSPGSQDSRFRVDVDGETILGPETPSVGAGATATVASGLHLFEFIFEANAVENLGASGSVQNLRTPDGFALLGLELCEQIARDCGFGNSNVSECEDGVEDSASCQDALQDILRCNLREGVACGDPSCEDSLQAANAACSFFSAD